MDGKAAPFAPAFDLSITSVRYANPTNWTVSGVVFGAGLVWYVALEARWFMVHAGVGYGKAMGRLIATLFVGAVLFILTALTMVSCVAPA